MIKNKNYLFICTLRTQSTKRISFGCTNFPCISFVFKNSCGFSSSGTLAREKKKHSLWKDDVKSIYINFDSFNKIKGLYLNKIKGLPFSLLRFIPGTRYFLAEKKRKPFSFFYSSAFLYQIPSDPNIRVIFIPIKEKVKKISFFKKVLKIITFFFVALFLKSLCQYSLGAEQTILEILFLNLCSPYSWGSVFGGIFTVYLMDSGDENWGNSGRAGDSDSPERPGSPAERPGSAGGSNTHGPLSAEQIAERRLEHANQNSQNIFSYVSSYNQRFSGEVKEIKEVTDKVVKDSKTLYKSSVNSQSAWYGSSLILYAKLSEGWSKERLNFADSCFKLLLQTPSVDPTKRHNIWEDMQGIVASRGKYVAQQSLIMRKDISIAQRAKEMYIALNVHHNEVTKCWNRLEPVLAKEFKKTDCYTVNPGLMEKILDERRKIDSEYGASYNEYKKALHPVMNQKLKKN
jgi:hypothetical protein